MTESEAIDVVLRNLAIITGKDVAAIRAELADAGNDWPYDSLVLAELLVAVEAELGFEVPMDTATAKALRSVKGLARRLVEVAPKDHAA